jgi:predicted nucleic acid-binding protein
MNKGVIIRIQQNYNDNQSIYTTTNKMYEHIRRISSDIRAGRKRIIRLDERGEKGRIFAGQTAIEATCILGEYRQSNPELYRESEQREDPTVGNLESKEERLLTKYAKSANKWLDYSIIKEEAKKQLPSGCEADVFVFGNPDDTKYVIKVVDYKMFSLLPSHFIDNRIALYNALFPETNYVLSGFTKNKDKDFAFVLKQPYVEGHELIEEAGEYTINNRESGQVLREINEVVKEKSGLTRQDVTTLSDDRYIIEDVHLRNVLRHKQNGKLYFIDVVPSLNTANDEYQGMNYYREFDVIDNE